MRQKLLVFAATFALAWVGLIAAIGERAEAVNANAAAIASSTRVSAEKTEPTIFLRVKGARQGEFVGDVARKGVEGWIEVLSFTHEIVSPRDAASGLPTGKRQHKPLSLTKALDKTTPLFYNALVANENLPEVELRFFRTTKSGEQVYYTIKLINANVSAIRHDGLDGVATDSIQHLSFTYQKIIWTFEGGITAEDDWETPVA